ncbi:zonular occludens toxin family protein [Thalassolituus oleivorans]|uniref:zonular occludens toxin family protein n=1 Tax=Thalassolituus oleivorans TaxID=187493 RepID=UPI0023F362E5|nr:zonular occludens toxin domain-containing protein [Thalassolituus oleivorans]
MTAVIHHGPPGSYKSFAVVQDVVIPALLKGRTVVTNVRGLDSIERIQKALSIDLEKHPEFKNAQLITVKHDSKRGFEHMAKFFQWAPFGALIVMDEGQQIYPTRLRNLSEFDTPKNEIEPEQDGVPVRPVNVEEAFDKHRHMNWDIYVTTTNIGKIHKEVRAVAEYGIRHRDMSGILPWYKNKWREFKHDAESSGKLPSHYIGSPVVRKSKPEIFGCYQSTATGTAKASNENKSVFRDPKLRLFIVILILALSYFLYGIFGVIQRFNPSVEVSNSPLSQSVSRADRHDDVRNVVSSAPTASYSLDPFHDLISNADIYYHGVVKTHLFTVVSDGRESLLTSADFVAAGYRIRILSDCLVLISKSDSTHFATCEPKPLAAQSEPVLANLIP